MQSYTFDELDERGQKNAINKYGIEIVDDFDLIPKRLDYVRETLNLWRFTKHGERIA